MPRKRRADDPTAKRKAEKLYRLVRLDGLSKTEAYRQAFPSTKASRSSCSKYGSELFKWYQDNCLKELDVQLDAFSLDNFRIAYEVDQRLKATITRVVCLTESYEDGDGNTCYRDLKKLMDFEDNSVRLGATKLLAEIRHSKEEIDTEGTELLIIHRVGRLATTRGERRREQRNRDSEGKKGAGLVREKKDQQLEAAKRIKEQEESRQERG